MQFLYSSMIYLAQPLTSVLIILAYYFYSNGVVTAGGLKLGLSLF